MASLLALRFTRSLGRTIPRQPQLFRPSLTRLGSTSASEYLQDLHQAQEDSYWDPDSDDVEDMMDGDEEGEYDNDDTNTLGHHYYSDQRQKLYYMRLIEHDMPKFVAFRKPFEPPTIASPLFIRSLYYGGENHPVEKKRCLVVSVDDLPLEGPQQVHRLKLIAGPRWSIDPPKDGGLRIGLLSSHGYIKIACEDFPTPAMNFKWCSDVLDSLIKAAHDPQNAKFDNVPLDTRHIDARNRKKKNGSHRHTGKRPSIKDFPQEWLPLPGEPRARDFTKENPLAMAQAEPEEVQRQILATVLKKRIQLHEENGLAVRDGLSSPQGSIQPAEVAENVDTAVAQAEAELAVLMKELGIDEATLLAELENQHVDLAQRTAQ